jgi:hypothetical protein
MILDRDGLTLLLSFAPQVERVAEEATQIKDSLCKPGEVRTPEDRYLEDIVSGLERVQGSLSSLIGEYPEEAVLSVREELTRRGKL